MLYGDPKVGKSYLALQLADAMLRGESWMGWNVPTPVKVVYVQLDNPRSLWQDRLKKLAASGLDLTHLYQGDRETLTFPFDIRRPDHFTLLRSAIVDIKPDVVVIDTIRRMHQADENDSTTMSNVLDQLIAACAPAAIVVVAHSRKPSENGSDVINDNRGSNAVVGNVDAIIKLTKRTLAYSGRAIEEGAIRVHRLPNWTWERDSDEDTTHLESVLADPQFATLKAQADELAERLGISPEAAKKRIQRAEDKSPIK